eukprot:m51a1_g3874 hypothetical protein (360) ;mRNA; f:19930-21353
MTPHFDASLCRALPLLLASLLLRCGPARAEWAGTVALGYHASAGLLAAGGVAVPPAYPAGVFARVRSAGPHVVALGAASGSSMELNGVCALLANGTVVCDCYEAARGCDKTEPRGALYDRITQRQSQGAREGVGRWSLWFARVASDRSLVPFGTVVPDQYQKAILDIPQPNRGWRDVATGLYYACGVREATGAIECWGSQGDCMTPTDIVHNLPRNNSGFVQIALGWCHHCALHSDGSVNWKQYDIPEPNADWERLTAGFHDTCGVRRNGTMQCWGINPDLSTRLPPQSGDIARVVLADGTAGFGCAIRRNGSAVWWTKLAGDDYLVDMLPNSSVFSLDGASTCSRVGTATQLTIRRAL